MIRPKREELMELSSPACGKLLSLYYKTTVSLIKGTVSLIKGTVSLIKLYCLSNQVVLSLYSSGTVSLIKEMERNPASVGGLQFV